MMVEHALKLADGRSLSYTLWGPPDAEPVFYFHGFPSSHHELELAEPVLERNNLPIRIVALDRPGFGGSTLQPSRGLLDWPSDVAEAADILGIERFSVLGVSAGGPYALACGYALADRIPESTDTHWPHHGHLTWCDSPEAIDVFTAISNAN